MALYINSAPYNIDRNECLGNSLVKLNANAENFSTRLDALSSYIMPKLTYTEVEAVIGCTQTEKGYIGNDTVAIGEYYPAVERLADFRWERADGTFLYFRNENVWFSALLKATGGESRLKAYKPWQYFFPYRPRTSRSPFGPVLSTKMTVIQPVMDNTTSKDQMNYILYVDWVNNKATITGTYDEYAGSHQNQAVFNKKWDFSDGAMQTIEYDSNRGVTGTNTRGERNVYEFPATYSFNSPLKMQIDPVQGIRAIPVWSVLPVKETSNVSIFIENTYSYINNTGSPRSYQPYILNGFAGM